MDRMSSKVRTQGGACRWVWMGPWSLSRTQIRRDRSKTLMSLSGALRACFMLLTQPMQQASIAASPLTQTQQGRLVLCGALSCDANMIFLKSFTDFTHLVQGSSLSWLS